MPSEAEKIRLETQLPPHLEERVWAENPSIGGREQKFQKRSELKNKGHPIKSVKSKNGERIPGPLPPPPPNPYPSSLC